LNCAAIPATLIESGSSVAKRSFHRAVSQTIDRFQAADHGTLFLDEIGDLPLELQPKILRTLEQKQFERLGGVNTLHVDVRVIAATNQDLSHMVRERKFRADLFYRLDVFSMTLPPLRQRREDIPCLLRTSSKSLPGNRAKRFTPSPKMLWARWRIITGRETFGAPERY
jgi:formate hydrogenlyase transcriptional activator